MRKRELLPWNRTTSKKTGTDVTKSLLSLDMKQTIGGSCTFRCHLNWVLSVPTKEVDLALSGRCRRLARRPLRAVREQ